MACKPRARLLGRDDFKELLLPRGAADRRQQIGGGRFAGVVGGVPGISFGAFSHGQGLTMTSWSAGYPSLPGLTRIHPSAAAIAAIGQ